MNSIGIDAQLSKRFGLECAPTLATTSSKTSIAFTWLKYSGPEYGQTEPVASENSFEFQVLMRPIGSWEVLTNHGHLYFPPSRRGDVFLFNLSDNPRLDIHEPFDMVRCYITQLALDNLAYEHGVRRVEGLQAAAGGVCDAVLEGMAIALIASIERPTGAQTMFIEHMSLAFSAHVAEVYGKARAGPQFAGGLVPWQLRRVCEVMQTELNANHSISYLASECGLSANHFARAFKETTGLAPHQWLIQRRIEHACELLAQTGIDLATIAQVCGFVDQSHFSRVFSKVEKQSPGKWRRQRA